MSIQYRIVQTADDKSVVAVIDGDMLVAEGDHPNFGKLTAALMEGAAGGESYQEHEQNVRRLFDAAAFVGASLRRLSDRYAHAPGRLYFDGDLIEGPVADLILRMVENGDDVAPILAFQENLQANPNEHSRENLLRWLRTHDFTITEDGCFIGYKAVRTDSNGNYHSINHGPAIVDGESVDGAVPNAIGSVIEMPRSKVQFDPAVGCSVGLHAGTHDYARGFGGHDSTILLVKVNPRDVVSVPTDCGDAKVRCCRYTVAAVSEGPLPMPVWHDTDEPYDDEDTCDDCGYPESECECEFCDYCGEPIDNCDCEPGF